MATAEVEPELGWASCSAPGCAGARLDGREVCLAHLDDSAAAAFLDRVVRGAAVDGRGVAVDADLLRRILAVAPRDPAGRPRLRRARFDAAAFAPGVSFEQVSFERGVSFDGARFAGPVSFAGSVFDGHARFGRTTFAGEARFDGATFAGQCWFAAATFAGPASFKDVTFQRAAWFGRAVFDTDVRFDRAKLADVTFDAAEFRCHTLFTGVLFAGEARFDRASFAHEARYDDAAFTGKGGAPQAAVRQAVWSGAALAPWSSRAGAALLDAAVPAGAVAAALAVWLVLDRLAYSGALPVLLGLAALAAVVHTGRNLVEQGHTGQTAGKRRLGITLVRERDALPVGVRTSVGRFVLHVVDLLPLGLGFLLPLRDPKRRTLADRLLTTVVISRHGWARAGSSDGQRAAGPAPGGG